MGKKMPAAFEKSKAEMKSDKGMKEDSKRDNAKDVKMLAKKKGK